MKLYLDENYTKEDIKCFNCKENVDDVKNKFKKFFYSKYTDGLSLKEKLNLCKVDFKLELNLTESLKNERIFLCCVQFNEQPIEDEIFITQNHTLLFNFIESCFNDLTDIVTEIFIFECTSFEDAYKQSLDMKEQHPKCYESHIADNN